MKNKNGFTLAEVLITLGIIGVVASMTIPSVINKYKEKATVTAVKQAYSIFSQAYLNIVNEYDNLSNLTNENATDKENAKTMLNELSKHIKKIKSCDNETGCMNYNYVNLYNDESYNFEVSGNTQTAVLPNGMSFFIVSTNSGNSTIINKYFGQLGVDINGIKGPNKLGVDLFMFAVGADGRLTPIGSLYYCNNIDHLWCPDGKRFYRCNKDETINKGNGYACTSWILEHENMDYLKRNISEEQ